MICGIDALKNWVSNNKILYWRVYSADQKNVLYNSPENDGQTLQDSLNSIEEAFGMFGTGRYYVEGCDKSFSDKGSTKIRLRIPYEHVGKNGSNSQAQMNGNGGMSVGDEVERRMSEFKLTWELGQYKGQVDELKKLLAEKEKTIVELEKGNPVDRVIGRLEPAINMWLTGGQAQKASLSGTVSEEDYTARLEKAFEDWNEPNELTKLELLEKLSKLSVTNPPTYNLGKTMLMNQ